MRRTQLYLEDDLWQVLQLRARQSGTTMSELVRKAIRETYIGTSTHRRAAMTGIMGLWKDRDDIGDPQEYVRKLRRAIGKDTQSTEMTGPVLVDSDVLIELFRGRNHEISARWIELRDSDAPIFYSPITSAEIWRGAHASEAGKVAAAFSALTCIPIDGVIGKRAGEYLARFHASHGMEIGDALIAASSSVLELRLWTRNRNHFPMRDIDYF